MKLPKDAQREDRWQTAVENLINAAESGGGWLMFARIGMMRALNGDARDRWHQELLADVRVTHFWDEAKAVGRMYGQLEPRMMSRRAPRSKEIEGAVLWDSYLLYGPDAHWTDQPADVISWGSTILLSRDRLARDLRALVAPH